MLLFRQKVILLFDLFLFDNIFKLLAVLKRTKNFLVYFFRGDVLDHLIGLQNFKGESLPNALRKVLSRTLAGDNHGNYLHVLLDKFSRRFFECNQNLNLTPGTSLLVIISAN